MNNEGDSANLQIQATNAASYSATGLPTGLNINANTGLISGSVDPRAANKSPYTVTVSANDATGNVVSTFFTWNVADTTPPSFTTPGTQTNNEGDSVSLQVQGVDADAGTFTATGLPTGLNISSNGLISGTIASGAANNSPYTVVVSASDNGHVGTTTFTWVINIPSIPPPVITSQPTSQTVQAGSTATFTASEYSSVQVTSQWQLSSDGGVTWSNAGNVLNANAGTQTFTLTLSNVSSAWNGFEFQDVVTNSAGYTISDPATLNVVPPPVIITQPTDQTVAVGQEPTFTAAASGTPTPTVQWYYSSDGGTTWNIISGATSPTETFSAAQASWNGYLFEAVFTNSGGTATTNPAMLTVYTPVPPVITTQPTGEAVPVGGTATFTAAASGTPTPTVQWYYSYDDQNWYSYSGQTSTTLTIAGVTAAWNGIYFEAAFSNSTGTATTNPAMLTITVPPAITTEPANQTVTVGGTATFTAAASGSPTPSVQWYVSGDGKNWLILPGATSPTFTDPNVKADWNGLFYEVVFTNSAGSAATSPARLFVVSPPPPPPPVLIVPPLLALFDSFLGGAETINGNGTETITDSLFGIPLVVATFDSSGNFEGATLLGFPLPNWVWYL